jgi:hypothetical protein
MKIILISFIAAIVLLPTTKANETLGDPTRPDFNVAPSTQESNAPSKAHTLSAIFLKQGKRSAIISNKLYKVGDRFSGNQVVSINKTSVLLKNSDGYRRLKLINQFKKLKK